MIKKIEYSDIPEDFVKQAEKARASFMIGDGVHYWGYYKAGNLVGCTCLVAFKNGHGKIKSNFVLKEFRGQGIFTKLNKKCLSFANKIGLTNITLNCLPDCARIHIKSGAVVYLEKKTIKYLVYRF